MVAEDGIFFQQFEKSVHKDPNLEEKAAETSSDDLNINEMNKRPGDKVRLLSSKVEVNSTKEKEMENILLKSPAISTDVQANRIRGKSRDVRTRPIKSMNRNH